MKNRNEFGYTLIELLAVLTLIVAVGSIVLAIILSSLKATNRSNALATLTQNGNYALSKVSMTIQYACPFSGVSSNGLPPFDNDCTKSPPGSQYSAVQVKLFDDSVITYACSPPPPASPTSITAQTNSDQAVDLINTDIIETSACYFTCSQANRTDSPSIGIVFDLRYKVVSDLTEGSTTVPFRTTVTMRNINK